MALLLLLCVPATATAQGAGDYPANWCRNEFFPSDGAGFKLAKVGGNWTARVHFFNDDGDCPRYEVKCETKRYLVTGELQRLQGEIGDENAFNYHLLVSVLCGVCRLRFEPGGG